MNKKVIFLLTIPVLLFMSFLIIHFSFVKEIHNSQQLSNNLRVKQILSSDINNEIIKIKALFYQIPLLSSNQRSLKFNVDLLNKELEKTKKMLNILKDGGVYHKRIALNIVDKNIFEKDYIFVKHKESLEVIDLLPKIKFLQKKSKELENILQTSYIIQKDKLNLKYIKKRRKKIIRFSRGLNSVFRRMIENSNRLFYDSQIKLLNLEKKVKKKNEFYQSIEFSLIIFLILIFIIIGYIVIKKLTILNESLTKKLYTDELTNTYSRVKLEEMKFNESSVLMLIDIDAFSDINELYGIKKGDKVLQTVADKLKIYNHNWEVFRVSSDVFGIYLDDVSKMKMSIETQIENIKKHIMFESIEIDEGFIDINVTIGIAFGENVLNNAFAGLNMAKNENVSYKIFHSEDEFKKEIEFSKTWQKEIKYAIAEGRITPFFQPLVDKDKNIVKYECLMRMKKIEGDEIKYIPPFFLDVAIKTKQYLAVSRLMIENAFIAFEDGGEFSINLNYMDMNSFQTKEFIENLMKKYNAKNRVTFEILESEGIKDYRIVEDFLKYFKQFGVKIAIDDFGSGYSNFKRIMDLNPDYIKFDGSLIKNIDSDNKSYIVVKNMVNYAKELNIKTVAEFVHNKDVFDTCVYLGVDLFQGFYISKPKEEF